MKKWLSWTLLIIFIILLLCLLPGVFTIMSNILSIKNSFPSIGYAIGYILFTVLAGILLIYGIIYCIRNIKKKK